MYPSSTLSAFAGTSRSTVFAGMSSTASPRRKPASMNSSMCFGSGALAEYVVTGSQPSATATSRRSPMPRQSAAPSLWICQCMKVVRESIFCMRYMPTLRVPVRGSFVITAGRVMKGELVEVGIEDDVLDGAAPHGLGHRVGEPLELPEALHLLDDPLRRLHLEHVAELLPDRV